jgi:hypothetical protein
LLVEEEIAKRVGGDGCLECRKTLTQTNETLQEQILLARTHMDLQRGKLEMDRMYQNELSIYVRAVGTQNEVIELMEATSVDQKKTILALNKFIAAKHGRKHTGRRRVGPRSWLG